MKALSVRRCAWPLLCLLGSCAWSNPDNRPVWRAFEERVVPVDDVWFYSSLPVTVPLGFGAILCDVLVAHPAAVIDDAWYDAKELWDPDKLDFEGEYYTQLAAVPVRAGFGLPMAYFALHAAAMLAERRLALEGWRGRAWTVAWVILPLPLLFHGPFLLSLIHI